MKKLILLVLCLAPLLLSAQRSSSSQTIPVPSGTDTTFTEKFFTVQGWSAHYDYSSLDNTDGTLTLYGSNFHPDSNQFILLWIDKNNDGTNDNPKTLSDSCWGPWGEKFPYRWLIEKFTKGSNTSGNINRDARRQ